MYLTNRELCDRLQISRRDLERHIASGKIERRVTDPNGGVKLDTTLPKLARILAMSPAERERIGIYQTRRQWRPSFFN